MKERDPFTGSLFEPSPEFVKTAIAVVGVIHPELAPTERLESLASSDEIFRAVNREKRTDPDSRFCMVHMKWESNVAIYIDGKRPLFLCPEEAEKRGAWKWEGKWPDGK